MRFKKLETTKRRKLPGGCLLNSKQAASLRYEMQVTDNFISYTLLSVEAISLACRAVCRRIAPYSEVGVYNC